nr:helix-turn-helix transcriptional regulator [uncultured Kordia sp.]
MFKKSPKDHKPTENHKLSFYVLFVITAGEGTHTINYKTYSYKKGTIFSLRKGVIHKFTDSGADGTLLAFTDDFIIKHIGKNEGLKALQLFNELIESPKIEVNASTFLEIEIILEQLNNEMNVEKDLYTSSVKRSLLHILLSKIYREKVKDKKVYTNTKYLNQFLKFQSLIEAQWFESRTALHYAEQMSITPKTLNNIVKATIEKSAKSLIDDIVITQIKRLLVNTELSIGEIAYEAGFDDPTNFFKYFKKNTSLSPNQFREKHT